MRLNFLSVIRPHRGPEVASNILLGGCGNLLVSEILAGLLSRVSRLRSISLMLPDRLPKSLEKIKSLLTCIENKDRPGLDRRTRSIINLALITALNRPHELKLHVRGAINNGLTKGDIQEVFLQAAIYCGVPAAIDSFRNAKEVFKEMGI